MDMTGVLLMLVASVAALVLNLIFTPLLLYVSHKYDWYDRIDHRKIHSGKIPRIGGVGIFMAYLVVSVVFSALHNRLPAAFRMLPLTRYIPFLAGFLIINLLGLVDDFTNLRARVKILFQGVAALIITIFGHSFAGLYLPYLNVVIPFGVVSYLVTFLWLLGMCNAVNLLDGLDGLAGGASAIAALSFGVVFAIEQSYSAALFSFILGGALIAFLFFNLPPARLFMGDSGALFIGVALASMPLIEAPRSPLGVPLLFSLTILLIPILDTIAAILRRIRDHSPIHLPDRGHIHHKLLDLGVSNAGILLIIYAICAFLGLSTVFWVVNPADGKFLWVLLAWIVAVAFFLVLDVLNRRRRNALERNDGPG